MSLDASANGTLSSVSHSWRYANRSGIHGLALGSSDGSELLYSADLSGDAIWTHRLAPDGGAEEVGRFSVASGSHPRHVAAHPRGGRVYAVMEAGNRVAAFTLGRAGEVEREESTWSLIPRGMPAWCLAGEGKTGDGLG